MTILTLGAIGSIIGALIANKFKIKHGNATFLIDFNRSRSLHGLPLPPLLSFSGNLVCELFMTIFNIHFYPGSN